MVVSAGRGKPTRTYPPGRYTFPFYCPADELTIVNAKEIPRRRLFAAALIGGFGMLLGIFGDYFTLYEKAAAGRFAGALVEPPKSSASLSRIAFPLFSCDTSNKNDNLLWGNDL